MRRSARTSGFTVIEVMVSVAILAVALLTLIVSRNTSIAEASIAINARTSYPLLAYQIGDILRMKEIEEMSPYEGGGFEGHPGTTWERAIEKEDVEGTGDREKNRDPKQILKITLTVHFPTETETESMTLVAYRLLKSDDVDAPWSPPAAGTQPTGTQPPGGTPASPGDTGTLPGGGAPPPPQPPVGDH